MPGGDGSVRLQIKVSNSGPGVPPEVRPNLFQPFRQGDDLPTRRHQGLGLGLALVKGLAKLMGGDVRWTEGPGAGCRQSIPG